MITEQPGLFFPSGMNPKTIPEQSGLFAASSLPSLLPQKFQNAHFARHHARCKRPGKVSPDRATADIVLSTLLRCWSIAACVLSLTPVVFDRRQVDLNLKRQLRRWGRALVAAEASKVTMTRWSKLPACCLLLSLASSLSSV